jgi:16S rRNA (adenine1518-N6/adenine1519-N6)-dimethyltransferase
MSNPIPKKNLGQNFLTDKNKILEIVNSLNINENTNVIEIGPGRGALSFPIFDITKKLIVIEIDDDLIPLLKTIDGLRVIHDDVLNIDFSKIIDKETVFVSNLPYYISSKILFKAMAEKNFISVNVMMQKELIDRIVSTSGNKSYGRLTVAINTFYKIEKVIKVPSGCFTPSPNVESAFIKMTRLEDFTNKREEYLEFIKISFAQKRKK